jgi:hypothetical protein
MAAIPQTFQSPVGFGPQKVYVQQEKPFSIFLEFAEPQGASKVANLINQRWQATLWSLALNKELKEEAGLRDLNVATSEYVPENTVPECIKGFSSSSKHVVGKPIESALELFECFQHELAVAAPGNALKEVPVVVLTSDQLVKRAIS